MSDSGYEPTDRRPIATREKQASKRVASWLARRGVSPNAISIAGMIAGLLAGLSFAFTSFLPGAERVWWILAAALVQGRLIANMLDGMVAIESDRASPVGELYNEVPDRVSDAAILIGMGYAVGATPALGYFAACLALFVAYIRAMGAATGVGQDFRGPMAKPHRMFVATVAALYLGLTPSAWQPILCEEKALGIAGLALVVIASGSMFTATRRLQRTAETLKGASDDGDN